MYISNIISNSTIAEQALISIANGGHDGRFYDGNKVSIMNLGILKKRFQCTDIFPLVTVGLVRCQDRKSSKRVELARIIGGVMQSCLSERFTGDARNSELVLRVHIGVVSDGSSLRNDRMLSMFGRGKSKGHGLAKLVVSYCLFSRVTGAVAVVKQLCRLEDICCSGGRSALAVLDLTPDLHKKISREVIFMCSGHASVEWTKKGSKLSKQVCTNTKMFGRQTLKHRDDSSCSETSNDEYDDISFAT